MGVGGHSTKVEVEKHELTAETESQSYGCHFEACTDGGNRDRR